jgi:hypothetical protein
VIESDAHESNGPNVSISSKIDLAVTTEIDLSNALPFIYFNTKPFLLIASPKLPRLAGQRQGFVVRTRYSEMPQLRISWQILRLKMDAFGL